MYGTNLFKVMFSFSNGPVLLAIILWRNSMVFHSVDKMTSLFIHSFPPLYSYTIRWYPTEPLDKSLETEIKFKN